MDFFPHLKLCVVFSYNLLGLCIFNIEQKNSIKFFFDKNGLHSEEDFWYAIFIPCVDHVLLNDHTHLQGQMVDFFELFDLWYIFMTKYMQE